MRRGTLWLATRLERHWDAARSFAAAALISMGLWFDRRPSAARHIESL